MQIHTERDNDLDNLHSPFFKTKYIILKCFSLEYLEYFLRSQHVQQSHFLYKIQHKLYGSHFLTHFIGHRDNRMWIASK